MTNIIISSYDCIIILFLYIEIVYRGIVNDSTLQSQLSEIWFFLLLSNNAV